MAGVLERDVELADGGREVSLAIVELRERQVGCGGVAGSLMGEPEQAEDGCIRLVLALEFSEQDGGVLRAARPNEREAVAVHEGPMVGESVDRGGEEVERPGLVAKRRVRFRGRRPVCGSVRKIPAQLLEHDARFLVAAGAHEGDGEPVAIGLDGVRSSGLDQCLEVGDGGRGLVREPHPELRPDKGIVGALPVGARLVPFRAPEGIGDS